MYNLFGELTFVNELFTVIYPSINRTSFLSTRKNPKYHFSLWIFITQYYA